MPDSNGPEAEPELQLLFSVLRFAAAILLGVAILNWYKIYRYIPDRVQLAPAEVPVRFERVAFDPDAFGGLKLAGAWKLSARDPRFGGLSAIAVDGEGLVAVNDSGTVLRFPKPGAVAATVRIEGLPVGPGDPRFKRNRDSESLAWDPQGRGWWIGFEKRYRVWLFDRRFERVLAGLQIASGWPRSGFEAIVPTSGGMLMIPESGGKLLAVFGGRSQWMALPAAPVSDAARLPDGSLLVVERGLHLDGLRNRLVQVRRQGNAYVAVRAIPLGVGRFDNVEGLAVEPGEAGGALRLWLITDDGHQWPQRTVLVALDWPPAMDSGRGS